MVKIMNSVTSFLASGLMVFFVACSTSSNSIPTNVLKSSNTSTSSSIGDTVVFRTDIAEDATPAVLARILKAEAQPISAIKFEKGTYHFYPDKGYEVFAHISNHDDGVVSTAFPILNFKNLVIDGQGANFIFHGRMIPFLIENSENIRVENLSVDWAMPFHSEGLVVANDLEKKTFDLQISDDYPYEIRNDQLYFIKEYYAHSIGQSILYDPKRKAIAYDTESYTPLTAFRKTKVRHNIDKIQYKYKTDPNAPPIKYEGREDKLRAEHIEPGLVRIYNHTKKIPPIGMILVGKGMQSKNRLAPAFRITHTTIFNAQNITVHHAGGMGLIAENSADLTLDNFNVTPSNGRMVSTTADATHFVGCRGKVTLKNCNFNNQLDDASNIHGTYQEVRDIIDDYTIGVRMGHYQQQGFTIGKANDTLGLVRLSNSFFPYDKVTIKATKRLNRRYQLITLNKKVPQGLKVGDLIENLDAYPELLVQNCKISGNRARGLLLSTPRKIVVDNNYFHTEMEALLIPVESGKWFESGSVTNLTISNNIFQDCTHSGQNRGIIRFETDDDNANIAFKNIQIINNKINQFDNLLLEISNTDNLLFEGNTITNSGTFPKLHPENPAIVIHHSKNINFKNNKYEGHANTLLKTDKSLSNLKFE